MPRHWAIYSSICYPLSLEPQHFFCFFFSFAFLEDCWLTSVLRPCINVLHPFRLTALPFFSDIHLYNHHGGTFTMSSASISAKSVFGIAVAVVIVIWKKLFYKKYFYLRLVWKNRCLVKTVVKIEVEEKII